MRKKPIENKILIAIRAAYARTEFRSIVGDFDSTRFNAILIGTWVRYRL